MRRTTVLLVACGLLAGCGDATGPRDPVGTYTLRSVNGDPLPWRDPASTASQSLTVTAGHIRLNADGTYSEATSWTATNNQATLSDTDRYTGTWTRRGNNIALTVSSGASYSVAWEGRTLTQVENGYTIVYRK